MNNSVKFLKLGKERRTMRRLNLFMWVFCPAWFVLLAFLTRPSSPAWANIVLGLSGGVLSILFFWRHDFRKDLERLEKEIEEIKES